MNRPRTFDRNYMESKEAARQLRKLADYVEATSEYACWTATISVWKKAWEDYRFPGGQVTQATFCSRKP